MNKLKNTIVCGMLFSLMSLPSFGQELSGISGAFVDIGFGGRASGLGFAYTGLAENADAVVWNPAGMGQAEQISISTMYTKQYDLVNYNYMAGLIPLQNNHVIGIAVISSGDDVLRENTLYASYANSFKRLYIGGTVKYRFSNFGNNILNADDYVVFTSDEIQQGFARQVTGTGKGIGFDAGILFEASDRVKIGIMARDAFSSFEWDSKIRSDDSEESAKGKYNEAVPFEVILGFSYNLDNQLYLTTDIQPSLTEEDAGIIRSGIEKKFLNVLLLRAGTEQKVKSVEVDNYMLGFGLNIPVANSLGFSADYTYMINELMNSHRIGISIKF